MKHIFKNLVTKILVWEAKIVLRKFSPKIIGITGSSGKSSTKEAVFAVLERKFRVRKSIKSYNSALGLALAVLGLESAWHSSLGWLKNIVAGGKTIFNKTFPEILVLEMGVDRPRDLDILLNIAKPEIGIVTAIGEVPVHVEFFFGPEEIAKEKSKLIEALPGVGHAILNFDDEAVRDMKEIAKAHTMGFGFGEGANVRASNYKLSEDSGISFKIDYEGSSVPVHLHDVFGKHYVYAALAATAVGVICNINLIEIAESLSVFKPLPGRLRLLKGIKNSSILDDSYNASPLATHAALDTLAELGAFLTVEKKRKKIVVFGDMLELGKFTVLAHKSVGEKIADIADYFIAVGLRAKFAAEEALSKGMNAKKIKSFSTSSEAASFVKEIIAEDDLVLVKGSQSIRMEKVVEEIMAEPERAGELLCRQDVYWKTKE